MKIVVDNQVVRLLLSEPNKICDSPLLRNAKNQLSFKWPSLLEYLGLGTLFSTLPVFDQNNPLFKACISTLGTTEDQEVVFHLFDRLFAENLNYIKALPQIKESFLLQAIKAQRQKSSSQEEKTLFFPALAHYEASLAEKPSQTMHDLILYLAWDRMCICAARLFDYQSTDPKFLKNIAILRDCLIESYQHIIQKGQTIPGIYRMLESFLFYYMREENLEKLTDAEWVLLSQSFQVLKAEEQLADFFYIDDVEENNGSECYLTLDSPSRVNTRLSFARCMVDKLKTEVPTWRYTLEPKEIVYLEL